MTPPNTCLDAETLAAWADGGLNRNDAAMAEAHVSSCPRCQEIAGLIVKTTPVHTVAAPWWRRRAAWLVPVTAGVAAAGLWIVAPTNPAPNPQPPPAAVAKVESAPNPAAPAAPPVAPPAETRKERQREARANTAADAAAAPAAAPSAAAAPQVAAPGRVAAEQAARGGFAKAVARDAVSPDGGLHWRITDRGALERSTDRGRTWEPVNVGASATFTSVEAPEPRTALVTTTDGRVFRTSDGGLTWRMQEI